MVVQKKYNWILTTIHLKMYNKKQYSPFYTDQNIDLGCHTHNVFKWIHYLLYGDILISFHFLYLGGYLVSCIHKISPNHRNWSEIKIYPHGMVARKWSLFCLLGSSQWTRAYDFSAQLNPGIELMIARKPLSYVFLG